MEITTAAAVIPAETAIERTEAAEERENVTAKREKEAAKGPIAAVITTDPPEAILTAAVQERKRERREERKQERREERKRERREEKPENRKEAAIFHHPGRIILLCPDGKDVTVTN